MKKEALDLKPTTIKQMKALILPLMGVTGVAGAAGLYGYMSGKKNVEQHKKDLADSLHVTFSKNPKFKEDPQKFAALFGELSVIAPTVAKNPQMASKLLTERLTEGFSLDDVHKLSVIESSRMGTAGRPPAASAAARAAAIGALEKSMNLFGMEVGKHTAKNILSAQEEAKSLQNFADATADYENRDPTAEEMAEMRRQMQKKSSADFPLYVSEECLGRMVSDRVHMMKTASKASAGISEMAGKGVKALADHLAYIAPALALGGGIGLVKLVYDRSKDAHLQSEAEDHFKNLMRTNETLKQDPQMAREAFDTIRTVAPALAARPPVLRSYLEQQVGAFGRIAPDTIKSLAEANSAVDRSITGTKGFMGGMKSVMESLHLPVGLGKGGPGSEETENQVWDPAKNSWMTTQKTRRIRK